MSGYRYLCPICDHELVARGYCPSCKKVMKNPVVYKGAYLPNEDRGNYSLNKNIGASSRPAYTGNRQTVSNDYGNCGGHKDSDYGVPNRDPHSYNEKRAKKVNIGSTIFIITIIIYVIFYALEMIIKDWLIR